MIAGYFATALWRVKNIRFSIENSVAHMRPCMADTLIDHAVPPSTAGRPLGGYALCAGPRSELDNTNGSKGLHP